MERRDRAVGYHLPGMGADGGGIICSVGGLSFHQTQVTQMSREQSVLELSKNRWMLGRDAKNVIPGLPRMIAGATGCVLNGAPYIIGGSQTATRSASSFGTSEDTVASDTFHAGGMWLDLAKKSWHEIPRASVAR